MTSFDSTPALMPEDWILPTIGTRAGGWLTPWSVRVDRQRRCWLNLDAHVDDEPGGTVRMRVDRDGQDGWIATIHGDKDYRFSIDNDLDLDSGRWAPVSKLGRQR